MPMTNDVLEMEPPEVGAGLSRQTMKALPFSLVLTDPHQEGNPIVYVNRAFTRTTGYAPGAAVGRNCRFLQGEGTEERDRHRLREAISEAREVTVDIVNYAADGTEFVNRLLIAPLFDEEGTVRYFLGVQTRRGDYSTYADRNRDLDERLREIQHRVKNHLTMIVAMIRLEARTDTPERALAILSRRVETLSLLYDEFAQSGTPGGEDEVALGAFVSRVCAATQDLVRGAALRVNVSVEAAMIPADDAARLGLFLSEVLNNALEHAYDEGETGAVSVRLAREAEGLVLEVSDEGRGMAPGTWPNEDSLGGRIVRDLVRRLGGTLSVDGSDGTTVRLVMG